MRRVKTLVAGGATIGLIALFVLILAMPAAATHPEKVTICHAAGLAGTTHYETLTIGYQAVYGPGGHFSLFVSLDGTEAQQPILLTKRAIKDVFIVHFAAS